MKQSMKKVLSVVLSVAMIATSITVYNNTTVKAADLENIQDDSYNLAYGKTVTASGTTNEGAQGNLSVLTDGNATNSFIDTIHNQDGWFVVDLGDYYSVDSIDRIVTVYHHTGGEVVNTSPMNTGYTVEYSNNPYVFKTAKTVAPKIMEDGNDGDMTHELTMADQESTLTTVRYVKLSYPPVTYGTQIEEIAIFNDAGAAEPAEVVTPTAPTTVDGQSDEPFKLTVTFTKAENTTVVVLLDDAVLDTDAVSGTTYENLSKGEHTLKVLAYDNETYVASNEVTTQVTVDSDGSLTPEEMVANPEYNVALNKTWYIENDESKEHVNSSEGTGSITDGSIEYAAGNVDRATPPNGANYFVIDLGKTYKGETID